MRRWLFPPSSGGAATASPSTTALVRVAPSAIVIPEPEPAEERQQQPPSRSNSSRLASRRHAGSETPKQLHDAHAPTPNDLGAARRSSKRPSFRGQPIHFVFPAPHGQTNAVLSPGTSFSSSGTTTPTAEILQSSSVDATTLSIEHQQQVRALFDACDGDDDGKLHPNELQLILELLGVTWEEAHDAVVKQQQQQHHTKGDRLDSTSSSSGPVLTSFSRFTRSYHGPITVCVANNALPRSDFVLRCKRLKYGLKKADGNGDAVMTRAELEIALQKLDFSVSDHHLNRIFTVLDRNGDGRVEWSDYIYAAWHDTLAPVNATMSDKFSIDMLADLPTLFRAAAPSACHTGTVSPVRTVAVSPMKRDLSAPRRASLIDHRSSFAKTVSQSMQRTSTSETAFSIERLGVEYLTRISMERLAQTKRSPGSVVGAAQVSPAIPSSLRRQTSRTGFSASVRRQIQTIEATAVVVAALAGILCGLLSMWFETMIATRVDDGTVVYFVYVVLVNIVVSVVEVHGMYATAVVCAFRLTVCTNLKLYPQDAEREFLTRSIARAALQVGLRKDKIFGIDPMKGSPRIVLFVTFLMYKSKRYVLKSLLKLLIKRVVWRAAAKSMLSLMVLPVNAVMNAWTLRRVMLNCRVSIIGPPCVASLLEAFFLQGDDLSPLQRVDCMRVIGCVLVAKRSIHPNIEIMIEHLRHQWLKLHMWPTADDCKCLDPENEPCPRHVLDDMDLLMASLQLYASQARGPAGETMRQHLRNMFFLLIVALVIDGGIDWIERRLYIRLCHAGRMKSSWKGVLSLKDGYIAGKGIHIDAVYALVQEDPKDESENDTLLRLQSLRVPWRESLQYTAHRVSYYLAW